MTVLTTHNASITTATVEIKTLTVSGKQVTLAVFRQLQEDPLIAEDGTLNGTPWGTVNYHPDKCSDGADHWHVVWQKDEELRRSRVTLQPRFGRYWDTDWADQLVQVAYCRNDHVRFKWAEWSSYCEEVYFQVDEMFCLANKPESGVYKSGHECSDPDSYGQALAGLRAGVAVEKARRQQHIDTRFILADLPQLFIAV